MSTLLERLEALANSMWEFGDQKAQKAATYIRTLIAAERKRLEPVVPDSRIIPAWSAEPPDPDSRIVHGEPGDGWISVKDRPPGREKYGYLLYCEETGIEYVGYRMGDKYYIGGLANGDHEPVPWADVTHWQPLPEPPGEAPTPDPRDALLSQAREALAIVEWACDDDDVCPNCGSNRAHGHAKTCEIDVAITAIDAWKERKV